MQDWLSLPMRRGLRASSLGTRGWDERAERGWSLGLREEKEGNKEESTPEKRPNKQIWEM